MRRWRRKAVTRGREALWIVGAGIAIGVLSTVGTLVVAPTEPGAPRAGHQASGIRTDETQGAAVRDSSAAALIAKIERVLARRQAEGQAVVRRLCLPEYAGRKAGTPGADHAAAWLATEFRRIGLEPPPGAPGYLQRFTMPVSLLASRWDRKAKLIGKVTGVPTSGKGARQRPAAGRVALIEYPCFRGEGFSAEAEAIFAGWGVSRRDQGWDDYHGPNVQGKYVVYWEGAPGPGLDREENARWRDAKARGALGCLILSRRTDAEPAGLESPIRDFPVLRLDPATAQRVLNTPVPPPGTPPGQALPPLRIEIPAADDPARPTANVIGILPGADPALADEVVILSAHYDHLGASPTAVGSRQSVVGTPPRSQRLRHCRTTDCRLPRTIYPGADDDASGVAVVLGVARALRAAGARPRRTVMFCLWSAEECGLLGSRAYVQRPLAPLEKTRFVLQVEMVGTGRADTFETSAGRLAGSGYDAVRAAAARLGLFVAGDSCKGVSDHLPFTRRGVSALVLTTSGEHPDYHTPRDTPDRLHPEGIDNATRLCALAVWQEANREECPAHGAGP